jgi:hypothetical protein
MLGDGKALLEFGNLDEKEKAKAKACPLSQSTTCRQMRGVSSEAQSFPAVGTLWLVPDFFPVPS